MVSFIVRVRRRQPSPAESKSSGWTAILLIVAGVVVELALMEYLGFVIASAFLFWLTARAFESRHPLRDAASAVAVSTGAYLVFARLLDLHSRPACLPGGCRLRRWKRSSSWGRGCPTRRARRILLWALAGVTVGTAVGVLPGIGPALTVAILLPVTFSLDPTSAFIMFAGIYSGAMYGGSTTSILINTPGETASMMTAVDGHMMARKGRASAALATAAIGSFVAGTIGTVALTFAAPLLASVALRFGPAEYFALSILAFTAVVAVGSSDTVAGLLSLTFGLLIGLVGIDQLTGAARFSFGLPQLLDGIDVMILVIGLFAVGETLFQAWNSGQKQEEILPLSGSMWMSKEDWQRSWGPWLRGTLIGFPLGVLPAGGAVIPTFVSYMVEKQLSARPEEFGHGAIEGVAGPEAANNAAAAGVLVPLLTLGLPSSATAAILLTAFQQYGLQPGPLLFAAGLISSGRSLPACTSGT